MKTMQAEGYRHIWAYGNGQHILLDTNTSNYEIWFANKNHANYGLKYKNTHLEFARTVNADDARQLAIDWQNWQSEQSLYMSELADWHVLFETLATRFNLTEEFSEEGIL